MCRRTIAGVSRFREALVPAPTCGGRYLALLVAASLWAGSSGCGGGGHSGAGGATTSIDAPAGPEPPGDQPGFPFAEHLNQSQITAGDVRFRELFVIGDELFEARFNTLDGVGALQLPDGTALPGRFSRSPPGGGRFTGPNAQSCNACHNTPFGTSAGEPSSNVLQDPSRAGAAPFNTRNTTSLFGAGLLQRLAEEMTEDLLAIRAEVAAAAEPGGPSATRQLSAKGVSFGSITATRDGNSNVSFNFSALEGVSRDLVVRPFGWKGDTPSLRVFCRNAALNELGMEAEELVAKDDSGLADLDGDGVEGELTIGDVTAVTIYVAAQESPTTLESMARRNLLPPPGSEFVSAARRGRELFSQIGCDGCHVPEMRIVDPVFEEPTLRGGGRYFDDKIDRETSSLDPAQPFRFHLGREGDFPRPEPHPDGGLRVALFGDLKRHNMGSQLADAQEQSVVNADGSQAVLDDAPFTVAKSVFLTAELWGVGSTGPWLHDGRATTLEEATLLHGVNEPEPEGNAGRSEAQEEREAFAALSSTDRESVVTFLKSLILFEKKEE